MAASNLADMFGAERRLSFPKCPQSALILGITFQRLGGWFSISSDGSRGMGQPLHLENCPQLVDAKPHEQLRTDEEMRGALKIIEALFRRCPKSDRDYVFSALALTAVDERKLTPSIEEPRRVQ